MRIGRVKTAKHDLADIGPIIAIGVLEKHEVRLLREIDAAIPQFQTRGHMQAIGKHRLPIGSAVAVGILENQNLVVDRFAGQIHRKGAHRRHPHPSAAVECDRHRIAQVRKFHLGGE